MGLHAENDLQLASFARTARSPQPTLSGVPLGGRRSSRRARQARQTFPERRAGRTPLSRLQRVRTAALRSGVETHGTVTWKNATTQNPGFGFAFHMAWKNAESSVCRLTYHVPGTGEPVTLSIDFACTHPNWGGVRFWFVCPVMSSNGQCGAG